ncbi:MAG: type I-A CRISPR-associated protein Cas4/Csa1 [Dethiobacteria bacterium]|jgi:CRISPR-associated protein Csa1
MYFLTDNERKKLLKGYLPKSREQGVVDELRGWNWHQPPLEPIYEVRLPLYQIAGKYCPSGRDLYLNRVERRKSEPNIAMQQGLLFHDMIVKTLVYTKKLIYQQGTDAEAILVELASLITSFSGRLEQLSMKIPDIQNRAVQIFNYTYSYISCRFREVLARQPYIGEDSLAAQVVPFVLEQRLDGTFLGLSPNLSSDAFVFSEPMIMDLKFGPREPFHRLTTTGYALVMEAIFEYPINIGCIVYGEFKNDRLHIEKDFHIINDELRQWFIEERDEKMRMVYDEIDPGKADNCAETCPFYRCCV